MKRRSFLRVSAGGVAASLLGSSWLERAFADVSVAGPAPEPDEEAALAEGFRRARAAGKPLLVIVAPVDPSARWDRARAWGELINHGSDEQLYPLALFEAACATLAAVRRVAEIPPAPEGEGEPMALLLDAEGRRGAPALRADVTLHGYPDRFSDRGRKPGEEPPSEEQVSARRIAALSAGVNELMKRAGLPSMVERTRSHLPAIEVAAVDRALALGTAPAPALVDRGASLVVAAALTAGPRRPSLLAHLVSDSVVPRLRQQPPSGSHWGLSGGCGTSYEPTTEDIRKRKEEEERQRRAAEEARKHGGVTLGMTYRSTVSCGMGHVPEKARRFLGFFVKYNSDEG